VHFLDVRISATYHRRVKGQSHKKEKLAAGTGSSGTSGAAVADKRRHGRTGKEELF
jgi:hypothetical protein